MYIAAVILVLIAIGAAISYDGNGYIGESYGRSAVLTRVQDGAVFNVEEMTTIGIDGMIHTDVGAESAILELKPDGFHIEGDALLIRRYQANALPAVMEDGDTVIVDGDTFEFKYT